MENIKKRIVGIQLKHFQFGAGRITDFYERDGKYKICVSFETKHIEFNLDEKFDKYFYVSNKNDQLFIDEIILKTEKIKNDENKPLKKPITHTIGINFMQYSGSKAQKSYIEFCDTLGWDITQSGQFASHKPLYGINADTKRLNDVWYIAHSNYTNTTAYIAKNSVDEEKEIIKEKVKPCEGFANGHNRVVFIKHKNGYYYFHGVYELIQNGSPRIWKRVSKNYYI